MIGISLHSRIEREMSTPLPSGRIRSRIAASGGRRDGVERVVGGLRGRHLEARFSQQDPQRAQDLALVVAHEHPRALTRLSARRRPWRVGALAGTGSWITKLVPWPGSDSARMRPPFASRKPRGDREAKARAGAGAGPGSGRRARRCARARRPEPPARGRSLAGSRRVRRDDPARPPAAPGEMARVLEHVCKRPLELGGVRLDERQVRIELDVEAAGRRGDRPMAPWTTSSTEHQSVRGSALPA